MLREHPYCSLCGTPAVPENPLNIDHIDNDPTNNYAENLQVLCRACNVGKEHHRRDVERGRVAA
ncbi:HNH endonuclease [Arthrobacter sp. M-10]|uniref:HNH endonuclease n=1 Tax=Arthrobacter sp. M-10 TaxID=3233037 RepID=UPI003F91FD31